MDNELDALRRRVQQLEVIAQEYERIVHLTDYAAQGQGMTRYAEPCILYVDPVTHRIIDATASALELLGHSKDDLLCLSIPELEIPGENSHSAAPTYVETSIVEHVYSGAYRHRLGHSVSAHVRKRLIVKDGHKLLSYHLEVDSLHRRLWIELQRREDDNFNFQQKLRVLNEITIELSRLETYDGLCQQIIRVGVDRLGFDRMAMWFLDAERGLMVGSYGVDEQGALRAEHTQSWFYNDTYIIDFIAGKTETAIAQNDAPIYNEKSEIIEHGWHISAPILHRDQFIGILTSDNYLHKHPMKNYEPELLRLYGITVGHLTELARVRDRDFTTRLEQERIQMLRQFIQHVGHDFRTPLSIINTKSYLLKRAEVPEQKQTLLDGINQQVMNISTMLTRMLEFMDMESSLVLKLIPTNLQSLLEEIIESHQSLSEAKHIQYEISLENAPDVSIDPRYLQKALSEIIENALLYTLDGGWIKVTYVHYPQEIGIRIQDNGVGIDKNAIDNIFIPLYRVNQARTERRNGLGLAIAKTLIEAHHGRIVVESQLGEGSIFEVILPKWR
jgi:signal transduction histidine kinase